jgi:hypothetical protein
MSRYIKKGVDKLPTVLGAGILGVAFVGLIAASAGIALPIAGEVASAFVAMAAATRYA